MLGGGEREEGREEEEEVERGQMWFGWFAMVCWLGWRGTRSLSSLGFTLESVCAPLQRVLTRVVARTKSYSVITLLAILLSSLSLFMHLLSPPIPKADTIPGEPFLLLLCLPPPVASLLPTPPVLHCVHPRGASLLKRQLE